MKKIKEEIKKKFLETHKKETTTFQNLWDAGRAILRGCI